MKRLQRSLFGLLLAVAAAAMSPAHAGDEVPYVPTPEVVVDAMLSMGEVDAQDNLVDLGSGDGRIVITAAKKLGASAVGIEYNSDLARQSRENAAREGVSDRVTILQQDLFITDISQATVVTMYLLPAVNLQLRPRILSELRPGTRVVSHDFHMGGWEPEEKRRIETPDKTYSRSSMVYLWVVPAQVAGRWEGTLLGPEGKEQVMIDIVQHYQNAAAVGALGDDTFGGGSFTGSGRIRGERFSLLLDRPSTTSWKSPLRFDLYVYGDSMDGEALEGRKRFILKAARSSKPLRASLP